MNHQTTDSKRFSFLFSPVSAYPVALFRIAFGVLVLYDVIRWLRIDVAGSYYKLASINLTYPGLEFISLSPAMVNILLYVILFSLVLVILGWFYRLGIIVFTLTFSVFFFSEITLYNNHLYLMCWLGLVLCFMDADKALSLRISSNQLVPTWNLYVLRFLVFVVYFYGGIAKFSYDWLVLLEPVKTMLTAAEIRNPNLAFINTESMAYFIGYGGVAFDLFIVFFLLWTRTRWLAVIGVLIFNLMNGLVLFDDIYIFPSFMICATVLFFPPDQVCDFVVKRLNLSLPKKEEWKTPTMQSLTVFLLIVFAGFHLLFPLRHYVLTENTDWTMEAQRFSWHMKSQTRDVHQLAFKLTDKSGKYPDLVVPFVMHRKPNKENMAMYPMMLDQYAMMAMDPKALVQFARFLAKYQTKKTDIKEVEVRAKVLVKYNGRDSLLTVDPKVDLLSVSVKPFGNYWIKPLNQD